MKHSFVTLMLGVVVALGFGTSSASAKGNGNTSSNSAPAPHRGSATTTTTVTPHFNGSTHYSSAMPYRATVSYRSGTRTLNYPAVGVSTLRHPARSGSNNFNNAYALQRSGNSQHLSGNKIGRASCRGRVRRYDRGSACK